jgi:hypothetical protein
MNGSVHNFILKGESMKKNRVLFIVLVLAALLASPIFAATFVIENSDGTTTSTSKDSPAFADAGLKGWTVQSFSSAGVDWFVFKLGVGAVLYPFHTSPDEWIGFILDGSGQVLLGDENKAQKGVLNFKKGDFLLFGKDTMHAWKNGPKETQILFLKATPPKEE